VTCDEENNIKIKPMQRKITPFGGIVLIKDLIEHLVIKEYIDSYLQSQAQMRVSFLLTK